MNDLTKANQARLNKQLDKLRRDYSGTVYTLRERIEGDHYINTHICIQTHATRKVELEYKKLTQPKREYCLVDADEFLIVVPKIVFDYVVERLDFDRDLAA